MRLMKSPGRLLAGVLTGALAASAVALSAAVWGTASAKPQGLQETASVVVASTVQRGLLREFLTVKDAGYFYTAYTPEAVAAVKKYHFHATGATFGYVDASKVEGTIALYRLHVVGRQAYIVTSDVSEKNKLLASHKFTLDGILGYIDAKPAKGTFAIWRLGKGPQPYWRLATTAQEKALVKKGWHLDGLVGFAFAKG